MVESTIDKIKDITVERQIRKLAGVIDEQNKKIDESVDFSTDIENLKTSDANQNTEINNLKTTSAVHTTDIDNLKASDANQTIQINNLKQSVATDKLATESAITALQNKDAAQDGTITDQAILIQGLTESLVSNVQIIPGTTTGDIKVRLEKESAPDIDSNDYNLGLPVSAEIIQGTGPSMFKIQLTMSSGVKVISNDFVFTTEAIGTDVYISSFTFKAGNQNGYLSADIGLNNGVTIEANNFLVPTDPAIISSIEDLRTSLSAKADLSSTSQIIRSYQFTGTYGSFNTVYGQNVKFIKNGSNNIILKQTGNNKNPIEVVETRTGGDVTIGNMAFIDSSGNPLNFSVGKAEVAELKTTVDKHTASISALNTDVAELQIDKVGVAQGVGNAGKVLGINSAGNVEPVTISSGGNDWETLNLSNLPTDFAAGDELEIDFKMYDCYWYEGDPTNWNTDFSSNVSNATYDAEDATTTVKVKLVSFQQTIDRPITTTYISYTMFMVTTGGNWSTFSNWNGSGTIGRVEKIAFNGASSYAHNENVTRTNIADYVSAIRRKKATT